MTINPEDKTTNPGASQTDVLSPLSAPETSIRKTKIWTACEWDGKGEDVVVEAPTCGGVIDVAGGVSENSHPEFGKEIAAALKDAAPITGGTTAQMLEQMRTKLDMMQAAATDDRLAATVALAEIVEVGNELHLVGGWAGDSGIYIFNPETGLTKVSIDDDLVAYLALPSDPEQKALRTEYLANKIDSIGMDALSLIDRKISQNEDEFPVDVNTIRSRVRALQKAFAQVTQDIDLDPYFYPEKNVFLSLPFLAPKVKETEENRVQYINQLSQGLKVIFARRNFIANFVGKRTPDEKRETPFVSHTLEQKINMGDLVITLTDGISDVLTEERIAEIIGSNLQTPENIPAALIAAARGVDRSSFRFKNPDDKSVTVMKRETSERNKEATE